MAMTSEKERELIELIAAELCSSELSQSKKDYHKMARAALSIAAPILRNEALEEAAKDADCFTSANIDPYQSGDGSFDRGYDAGVMDAGKLIASAIRSLKSDWK